MIKKIFIGCDIGKEGGICGIDYENKLHLHSMPKVGDQISIQGIRTILTNFIETYDELIIGVEDVHSIFSSSAKSNFQFGRALGVIEGSVGMVEIPVLKVAPKVWQKVAFLGVSEIRKSPTNEQLISARKNNKVAVGSIDTKAMALVAAQRLYPKETFLASSRSRKPHEGMIDSILIATYLKITNR